MMDTDGPIDMLRTPSDASAVLPAAPEAVDASQGPLRRARNVAVRGLGLDRTAAEVISALRKAGIECVVLKGPSIATWLYAPGEMRPYGDVDILVSSDSRAQAEQVLAGLGFFRNQPGWMDLSTSWRDSDGRCIDLHTSLFGLGVTEAQAWQILSGSTTTMRVGSTDVPVLDEPARALHLTTHAAQHGGEHPKPVEDLRRAIQQLDEGCWRNACAIAAQLEATGAMAAGLRLLPVGAALADELALPRVWSLDIALHAAPSAPMTRGFEQLSRLPRDRRLAFAARKLMPPRGELRQWSPLARRGRLGVALAYAWRGAWLAGHLGPGLVSWLRARRTQAARELGRGPYTE